jgi:hypothetical protein
LPAGPADDADALTGGDVEAQPVEPALATAVVVADLREADGSTSYP